MIRGLRTAIVGVVLALLAAAIWRSCALPGLPPPATAQAPIACAQPAAYADAARQNAASLAGATWSVFGRSETGWSVYAPLTAHEIDTACPPGSPAFAKALATWRSRRGGPASGVMDAATLDALRLVWLRRRPFLAASAHRNCPPAAPPSALVLARKDESYEGMAILLRPEALTALRTMVAAARAEAPVIASDHRVLTVFSGFRDPAADAARCAGGACGTLTRASCSAHRTGLAVDLYLGSAPGSPPASAVDANRLFESRTPAYLWLVANAGRFGFVNYPFEPWHWEWAGPQPRPRQP